MRRWGLPGFLLVVAVAAGWGAWQYRPARASAPAAPAVTTPVLSPLRLPLALTRLVADGRLAQRLQAALDDPALGPVSTASCMQVQVHGATVYDRHGESPLLPASNVKLLTGLAALSRLGGDAHLTTSVVAGAPAAAGVVNGPLWLVGGGDPLLVTNGFRATQTEWTWSSEPGSHLEELADRVKAAGVRIVHGGVIGDDSRYDAERSVPTWKPSYLSDGEIGAVGALVVDGGFASFTHHAPAPAPATTAAGLFLGLLRERGIEVDGGPSHGTAPRATSPIASLDSLPIHQIVEIMLRESDNLSGELLTKELGHRFGGAGTWSAGLAVVRQTLTTGDLPVSGLNLVDGSGLDRGDRATCALLVQAVDGPVPASRLLVAGLPVAGRNGTLVRRMVGQPPAGRLRAKTGSLIGVAALTGFIDPPATAPGVPPAAFSLLANGLATDLEGRQLEDRIAVILSSYPEAPPPDRLGPP